MTDDSIGVESIILRQAGALADLAFGLERNGADSRRPLGDQPLAFLDPSDLDLDLSDPEQRTFGDYELLAKLGQGGMGVVYRAKQPSLQREVALKLLAAGPWSSDEFIKRFRREARAAASLQHPNIVTVFDIGEHDELNFFTMRLVEGPTLAEYLDAQPEMREPRNVASIVRTVADAVDYAHRLGVLHLDIKPSNVLMDERGEPLVADFGLARQLGVSMEIDNDEVAGTPGYMAPEQVRLDDARLSPATDVYGIGALLYECLVDAPPFEGTSVQETIDRVQSAPLTPVRNRDARVPKDLAAICERCLQRDPTRRYLSARSLADDLGRFIEDRPVKARPLNGLQRVRHWVRREPRAALAAALAFVTLLVGFAATSVQWLRAESSGETVRNLLWESRRDASLDLVASGRGFEAMQLLALNRLEQEHDGLVDQRDARRIGMLQHAAPTLLIRRKLAPGAVATALSPNGEVLVVGSADAMVRWYSADTLAPLGQLDLSRAPGVAAGQTPALIRFVDTHTVLVNFSALEWLIKPSGAMVMMDIADGRVVEPPAEFRDLADVSYSADGRYALLRADREGKDQGLVQLWQVDPWRPLSERVLGPRYAHINWLPLPSQPLLASVYPTMQPVRLWGRSLERMIASVGRPDVHAFSAWSASGDGKLLALGDIGGRIRLVDAETGGVHVLPAAAAESITWIGFSEDDSLVAAGAQDGTVLVFDATTRTSLGGAISHDFPITRVEVRARERVLLAVGQRESTLWRLPVSSTYPRDATRVPIAPTPLHAQNAEHALSWAPAVGLMATSESDGMTSLWRLPDSNMTPGRVARQLSEQLVFDGTRVVQVLDKRVRIVAAGDGTPLSDWIVMPQPPGFAELRGDLLAVTSGADLFFYRVEGERLSLAGQLALPASPQRLALGPAMRRVVVTFGTSTRGYFEERLQVYELADDPADAGEKHPVEVTLPAPLRALAFASGGDRLLVFGTNPQRIDVFDAATLEHQARLFSDDGYHLSSFASVDGGVLYSQFSSERGHDEILRWNDSEDTAQPIANVGEAGIGAVARVGNRTLALGATSDFLFSGEGSAVRLPRRFSGRPVRALAVSGDGRLFARASRYEAQVYDARGTLMGQVLSAEVPGNDTIAQLAFAPDGTGLLARTARGRLLHWDIAPERDQPERTLARLKRVIDPGAGVDRGLFDDPGAWVLGVEDRRTDFGQLPSRARIHARDAAASRWLVNMEPWFGLTPDGGLHEISDTLVDMTGMPTGVQKIDGTFYDIRGAVIGGIGAEALQYTQFGLQFEVNARISAVHMLMYARQYVPTSAIERYFTLTFHYADDSRADVEVRTQEHVPGWTGDDAPVPIGWVLTTVASYFWDGFQMPISNPRLANPHPERRVESVELDWREGRGIPPVIFGITLEPEI